MTPRSPLGGAARVSAPSALGWIVLASGAVHAAMLAALAWHPAAGLNEPPADPATVQVEYVNQAASTKGAANPDQKAEPDPDTAGGAPAVPAAPPPPPPAAFADVPMPPAAPRADPSASAAGRPAVNLGDADDDRDSLMVTGDNVVSSGPDAKYRNMPPSYPHEAIKRHQQGTVQVLVHITPAGEAGEIELITSSGSAALDNAARDAVSKWHFKPAIRDGAPVASVFPLQMNFRSQ